MATNSKILIVEDDEPIAAYLQTTLEREGFEVVWLGNGRSALTHIERFPPDLILLDLTLPEVDGLQICRTVRQQRRYIPIIMVTAKGEDVDKIIGLEMGADDYITKPIKTRELLARIHAVLRLAQTSNSNTAQILRFQSLEIDIDGHQVTLEGQPVKLRPKEFDLLALLASNPGRVFGREMLLERVWGYDFVGESRTVDVHMQRLRQKIEPDPRNPIFLITVHHIGYKFAG
ncbi:response regulator transcription factor [Nitrosomonas nitrosa]|uniref:response regulator transcription factor n=1 Tax=Nitrosomonas nitrosa TaxID=52442 RepID=UPI0023F76F2A|nr:response regulator transcription factor [Nitrosomonas nitrosa]MCO6435077.1 response regulator transcription factor [Nitrosomonas nitrosa]